MHQRNPHVDSSIKSHLVKSTSILDFSVSLIRKPKCALRRRAKKKKIINYCHLDKDLLGLGTSQLIVSHRYLVSGIISSVVSTPSVRSGQLECLSHSDLYINNRKVAPLFATVRR